MLFPRTTEGARFMIRSSIIASSVVLCSSKGWSSVGTFLFFGVVIVWFASGAKGCLLMLPGYEV